MRLRVLDGNAEQQHAPTVVPIKVNSLGHLAPSDGDENCPSAHIAGALEVFQRLRRVKYVG